MDGSKLNQQVTRSILSFLSLIVMVGLLWALKPELDVYESSMYLPLETDRKTVDYNQVNLISPRESFLYKTVGYITITLPYPEYIGNDGDAKNKIVLQAKSMAAEAGADKLLLEGMRSSVWFDSGKRILRLQAVAKS